MKTIETTIYKCEHCGKTYQRAHFCVEHERMCSKNPKNKRPCLSCEHLVKKTAKAYTHDDYVGEAQYLEVEVFYCNAFNHFLYTPKNEIKMNWFENLNINGEEFKNEPMPKTCDKFQDKFNSIFSL